MIEIKSSFKAKVSDKSIEVKIVKIEVDGDKDATYGIVDQSTEIILGRCYLF
jgi:hypothetical protein